MKMNFKSVSSKVLISAAMMLGVAAVVPAVPAYATDTDTDTNSVTCKNADGTVNVGIKSGIKCAKSGDRKSVV